MSDKLEYNKEYFDVLVIKKVIVIYKKEKTTLLNCFLHFGYITYHFMIKISTPGENRLRDPLRIF